ncbi:MAG: adenylate/guanylate cyclase domain-containing protein [Gammaproteobacteria bacterium]|nr:adenylate/guanylate cyclase domain-containing protein [Gammaproteobacteria bacterium]
MPTKADPLVVLFADITGSTRLYEELGNVAAKEIVGRCISILSKVTESSKGRLIKTIGDEVMCTFPDAPRAVQAASEMQMAVRNTSQAVGEGSSAMRIKVGLHLGTVIEEQGDVFGDTVNVAARMVGMAKPEQILTTKATVDALPNELLSTVRFYDQASVKGKLENIEVYELIWEVSGLTMVADRSVRIAHASHSRLFLHHAGQELELAEENCSISMGRADNNDLRVLNSLASRQHARIEFRRGKFVLIDQSVNGTYIVTVGGKTIHLRREERTLSGSGKISLGEAPENHPDLLVSYTCE